jgi:2-keto-3-deoxy-L-rhamnonate aldolase RhmA
MMDFKRRLNEKGNLLGMQCFTGSPAIVEMLGQAGYDWVSLDMEHTPWDFAHIEHLIRAANASGICPLVRVAENDPLFILRALDAGAAGIIVPHVSSRADLERAVSAALYPPHGTRGACGGIRATGYGIEKWTDYIARTKEELVVVPLIEDAEAIEAFDDLLAVENVPVYWLGITDLALSLGVPGADFHDPKLAEIARSLNSRAAAAGKALMATVSPRVTVEYAHYLVSLGFRLISYASDVPVFMRTVRGVAQEFRSADKTARRSA